LATTACNTNQTRVSEVDEFLSSYTEKYLELYKAYSEAEWVANTKIVEGDTVASYQVSQAGEAFAAFTGSAENIEKATSLLTMRETLTDLQIKQLEAILYQAASNPGTVADLV